jgi:hypothetical protein
MKGLFIIIGESFRLGGQGTRIRGLTESYSPQINACNTHINFLNHIKLKYNCDSDICLSTYTTQYDNDLIEIYKEKLVYYKIFDNVIGLNQLFQDCINNINKNYDFVFYFRIDLYLKEHFFDVFNPEWSTIRFPTICWKKDSVHINKPRVNDMMLYIPNRFFDKLNKMVIGHEAWYNFSHDLNIDDSDMDVMINTYHDSDSQKDYNPLYYIVNRPESKIWDSEYEIFTKIIIVEKFINTNEDNLIFIHFIIFLLLVLYVKLI